MPHYILIVNSDRYPLAGIGDWEGHWTSWDIANRAYEQRRLEVDERKYLVRIDEKGFKIEKSTF